MRCVLLLGAALAASSVGPAHADVAHFGCDAAASIKCYFRLFLTAPQGSRIVILAGGMKQDIPGVKIGSDTYCMSANARPRYRCTRKTISNAYNN